MDATDDYGVLGLGPNADSEDVKTAFRYLSKKYHPDCSGSQDTSRRFVQVVKAYKQLNQEQRKDRLLRNPVRDRLTSLAAGDDVFSLGSLVVTSKDPEIRSYAARRLGFSGKKAAYVFLRQALSDKSEAVIESAVRSIADLSVYQASGEMVALFARSTSRVRKAILDAADATGESLFRSTLEYAAHCGGLEGLRARRLLSESSAHRRPSA